jgi:methionyl-tRNA formyltransferase
MTDIKVLLLCSSRLAIPTLGDLYFFGKLAAVAVPAGNNEIKEQVQGLLSQSDIPVFVIEKDDLTEQLTEVIDKHKINLGIIVNLPYKIPAAVYQLPAKGFYNVHPGPLPKYRGPDPVFQQIKNKEKFAGISLHVLDDGFDSGPVVVQEKIRIQPTDTYGLLTNKLAMEAAKLVGTLIKLLLLEKDIPARRQSGNEASCFPKQGPTDVTIDWEGMDAASIVALINACNPWNKGAVTMLNNIVVRLVEAESVERQNQFEAAPGEVISVDDEGMMVVAGRTDCIRVSIAYTDEGFFGSKNLRLAGFSPGMRFTSVVGL